MQLKPFQEDGVRFLTRNKVAILGDDTGLGKTAQLIRAADAHLAERVLIICQPISVVSWKIELPKWQLFPRPVFLLEKSARTIPDGPVAVIVTYDWLATRSGNALAAIFSKARRFEVAILDECQSVKTPSAKRTRAVYGRAGDNRGIITRHGADLKFPPQVWLSSATITPNHVGEIYPHLRALMPGLLEKFFGHVPRLIEFEDRFCTVTNTTFGRKIAGNNRKQAALLRDAIGGRMLVRSKADVLGELDPITCLPLPLDVKVPDVFLCEPVTADMADMSDEEFAALVDGSAGELASVSSERRELGMAKADAVWPWIENFLASGKKLVVFAHHRDVIDRLVDMSKEFSPKVIDGRTNLADKIHSVEQFQNGNLQLLIGQNLAASTSITLTAASDVLLVEPDWTPANNYQAISRCHRMGQSQPVTAFFAFAAGTMDERITQVLRRKAQDTALFLGKEQKGGHI